MLRIRLSMGGVRKRPIYKIVVADGRYPRDGKFIEKVGSYNPLLPKDKKERIKVEFERIKYWISKGAQPTNSLKRMLNLGNNEELYKDVIFKHNKKSKNAAAEEPAAEVAEEPEESEAIAKKSTNKKKKSHGASWRSSYAHSFPPPSCVKYISLFPGFLGNSKIRSRGLS